MTYEAYGDYKNLPIQPSHGGNIDILGISYGVITTPSGRISRPAFGVRYSLQQKCGLNYFFLPPS